MEGGRNSHHPSRNRRREGRRKKKNENGDRLASDSESKPLVHCRVEGVGRAGPARKPRAGKGTRYSSSPIIPLHEPCQPVGRGCYLIGNWKAEEEKQMILET